MSTHKNIKKYIYIETKHRSSMSNQKSKQNKPTKKTYKRNKNLYVQPAFSAMRKN